ncbi:mycofactocin biosynthesis chaperone MftB [Williamsia muralis]|uniref:Mycofactocin biosynthesis chaperone MftB n=1 Tax=Williamsia marianensis TaxID=85044 RepID=A0A2G3PIB3_WILMA|nr:mycofactocin biosynthesis chaperone MftB [Williamsia marianensis]PHV65551.1 mycofactocin biosynthesis chaperone MftB [Williamsia marianensis]PZT98494.1 MAG: mycofactocin biosynthesis chaperone MftB [Gordonia sp. (in: high G+C Gram-positive bacteria)]
MTVTDSGTVSVTGRATAFDSDRAWVLNSSVALRPEPFGALLYHFGTRKLSFLKNLTVVEVVQSLGDHASADDALAAAGIGDADRHLYVSALSALAVSGMIVPNS